MSSGLVPIRGGREQKEISMKKIFYEIEHFEGNAGLSLFQELV
jgi:hypothetical protein